MIKRENAPIVINARCVPRADVASVGKMAVATAFQNWRQDSHTGNIWNGSERSQNEQNSSH